VADKPAAWSQAGNWAATSGGKGGAGVPGPAAHCIFDHGGQGQAQIDAAITVGAVTVRPEYRGTILQMRDAHDRGRGARAHDVFDLPAGDLGAETMRDGYRPSRLLPPSDYSHYLITLPSKARVCAQITPFMQKLRAP